MDRAHHTHAVPWAWAANYFEIKRASPGPAKIFQTKTSPYCWISFGVCDAFYSMRSNAAAGWRLAAGVVFALENSAQVSRTKAETWV